MRLAHALGCPITLLGVNGCRQVFRGKTPVLRTGKLTLCVGKQFSAAEASAGLPADFEAFNPSALGKSYKRLARRAGIAARLSFNLAAQIDKMGVFRKQRHA
jgi:hypothetical protein